MCNWENSTTPGQPVGHCARRGMLRSLDGVRGAGRFPAPLQPAALASSSNPALTHGQESTGPITSRGSKGVTISRLLGVALLLVSGVTVASMTIPEQKDGRPAAPLAEEDVPVAVHASIVTPQATAGPIPTAPSNAALGDTRPKRSSSPPSAEPSKEAPAPTPNDADLVRQAESTPTVPAPSEETARKDDECQQVRKKARRAREGGEYQAVLRLTNRRSCWGPGYQTEYLQLRTAALLERNRSEECIEIGEHSNDPEVANTVESCQHDLDKRSG